ncbi:MAG: hypothetical protein QOE90_1363 [Thermoplasmata archaeon]|jgi:hypothetical protein|nr:hypothetical protein [Thermoplasmata archaeon]
MLLLAPLAAAQVPDPIVVHADALPTSAPLREPVRAPFTLDVSCVAVGPDGKPPTLHVGVEGPAWAILAATPSSFTPDPASCDAGRATFTGAVVVATTADAPAWTPAPITLSAWMIGAQGNVSGRATTNVTASFFSVLDVNVQEAVATTRPGQAHEFHVRVTNHGNDATRVRFAKKDAGSGVAVTLPEPFVLARAGADASRDVVVLVTPIGGGALTNRVDSVDVAIASEDDHAPAAPGDGSNVSFVLTTRGAVTPAPSPLAAIAALAMVGALRRRRCSRAS